MTRVLRLLGLDDTNRITVTHLSPDTERLRYECVGNVDVDALLEGSDFEVVDLLCGAVRSTPVRAGRFDVAFNAICDPDTNSAALRRAGDLVDRLGLPVVNRPALVARTTRDGVAALLAGVPGLVVPRTVRVSATRPADVVPLAMEAGVAPPMLVRRVGAHGGEGLVLVEPGDGTDALEAFAYDGRALYATEYVDCSSPDGWTRKWRVLLLDGAVRPRHLLASRGGWNVHAREREDMESHSGLLEEEAAWADGDEPFPAAAAEEIHRRLPLDYLALDFGRTAAGDVVLFEANPCARMAVGNTIRNQSEAWQPRLREMREAFADLLRDRAAQGRRD